MDNKLSVKITKKDGKIENYSGVTDWTRDEEFVTIEIDDGKRIVEIARKEVLRIEVDS
jgi:major membrane immunogen (membrane-anchored lipoprotein)